MSDERVEELQKELRNRLNLDLTELKSGQLAILARLEAMNEKCAKKEHVDALEARIGQLESDRAKIIGGMVILQIIGGLALFILGKIWK